MTPDCPTKNAVHAAGSSGGSLPWVRLTAIVLVTKTLLISLALWSSFAARIEPPVVTHGATELVTLGPTDPSVTLTVNQRPTLQTKMGLPLSHLLTLVGGRDENGALSDGFYHSWHFKLWQKLVPLLSWDAERFLKYANDDLVYSAEDGAAFFPLVPYMGNLTGRLLKYMHRVVMQLGYLKDDGYMPKVVYTALGGLLFANLASILAIYPLYALVLALFKRRKALVQFGEEASDTGLTSRAPRQDFDAEKLSFIAVLFFVVNPGTPHATSFYTEGFFSLATFAGSLWLLWAEDCSLLRKMGHKPLVNLVKMHAYELVGVGWFLLACFCRSNGTLLLALLFFHTVRTCDVFSKFSRFTNLYAKGLCPNGEVKHSENALLLALGFVLHWLKALVQALLLLVPMVSFQAYFYALYCVKLDPEQLLEISSFVNFLKLGFSAAGRQKLWQVLTSQRHCTTSWCCERIPSIYKYIQWKYWNVEFLYVLRDFRRLHIFTYAFATYAVAFLCMHRFYKLFRRMYGKLYTLELDVNQAKDESTSSLTQKCKWLRPIVSILTLAENGHLLHLASTTAVFLFYAHANILVRQSLPLVSFAMHFAICVEKLGEWRNWTLEDYRNLTLDQFMALVFLGYHVIFLATGIPLFSNFIGFT